MSKLFFLSIFLLSSLAFGQGAATKVIGNQPYHNYIINGDHALAQRGTSSASSGYVSLDRWKNSFVGSSSTLSRQDFTLGQTAVPGEPKHYGRSVVVSSAGTTNFARRVQPIEGVRTCAGRVCSLSFYAKADASKNIAVEFAQSTGTGGTPSASVTGIGVTTVHLTTSWQRFTVTTQFPSLSGMTLGTNNDDALELMFWFDAGTSFNARTNSLGQQSGTFDIAQVMLNDGPVAGSFVLAGWDQAGELALAQRYAYRVDRQGVAAYVFGLGMAISTAAARIIVPFPVTMRASPSQMLTSGSGADFRLYDTVSAATLTSVPVFLVNDSSAHAAHLSCPVSGGLTQFRPYQLIPSASGVAYLLFDAEI